MEKLASTKRAAVLRCLIEGNSVLSTSRITGVAKNTAKLLAEAGEACEAYHDERMRNLPCKVLQLDEVWSFVGCKEKSKKTAKREHPGDVWTWTSICADTKLIPSWRVGDRSHSTAYAFCAELSERFAGKVQITSDGHPAYQWAVGANFEDVDFAMLIKIYGKNDEGREVCIGARKEPVLGTPNIDLVSTSYVERHNLTLRMTNRRFTRLTNGFSKRLENHRHNLALCMMSYNFCKRHGTLKTTPAVAAGIANHQWTMDEVVAMIDAYWQAKDEAEFEAAFERKFTPARESFVTEPTPKDEIPLPWYLDPNSRGEPGKSEPPQSI
jgi:IS1 family transposase